jgi:hypothetical protein
MRIPLTDDQLEILGELDAVFSYGDYESADGAHFFYVLAEPVSELYTELRPGAYQRIVVGKRVSGFELTEADYPSFRTADREM